MKKLLAAVSIATLAAVSLAPAAQAQDADDDLLAGYLVTIGGTKVPVVGVALATVVVVGGIALAGCCDDDNNGASTTATGG